MPVFAEISKIKEKQEFFPNSEIFNNAMLRT